MPYIDKVGIAGSQYDIKDTTGTFIAPKEISPATEAHAAGTYLVYDGALYRVGPSAIVEGDTLTVGTNIETVPDGISGEVAALRGAFVQTNGGTVYGDIDFATGKSITIQSPDGTAYKLTVSNDGTLSTVAMN